MIPVGNRSLVFNSGVRINLLEAKSTKVGFANFPTTAVDYGRKLMSTLKTSSEINSNEAGVINSSDDSRGLIRDDVSTNGRRSTNIVWHKCSVEKSDRQELLQQKGCVIWITGLSGSGKSTLACALTRVLHSRGKLAYVLDGDNVRHGLNGDLTFRAEDRAENIRRIEKIVMLVGPYFQREISSRDPKGLYKLARAGKIKGFTGVDDPYEPPLNFEIVIQQEGEACPPPEVMAEKVISYLDAKGYLQA